MCARARLQSPRFRGLVRQPLLVQVASLARKPPALPLLEVAIEEVAPSLPQQFWVRVSAMTELQARADHLRPAARTQRGASIGDNLSGPAIGRSQPSQRPRGLRPF